MFGVRKTDYDGVAQKGCPIFKIAVNVRYRYLIQAASKQQIIG